MLPQALVRCDGKVAGRVATGQSAASPILADMRRSVLLLIAAAIGGLTSFTTAVDLVPRVRLVEVVLVFFGAFGAGAAFTAAVVELKTRRESRPSVRGRPLAVFLLIAILSGSAEAQTAPPTAPPDLDAYVARTLQTFSVPGAVGMTTSNVRHSDTLKGGNVATPHAPIGEKVTSIKPFDSDNTNPAGGINSNAVDMARWMSVLLARGALPDGSRLFPKSRGGS
jgi:hypothetical protein